jgi:hypothetical protein
MINRHVSEDQISNWEPRLKIPKTTFMLPVGSERPLDELGREAAVKVYGSHAPEEQLKAFARIIHDGTKDCKRRGVKMGGLIFFPDFNRLPPVANVDVFGYYSSQGRETPSSLEFYREHFGSPDKDTVGPVEVSDTQLPAGPAIRIHRRFWPKPVPRWSTISHQWEEVMYAVRPPQINDAVLLTVSWVEFTFSDALIKSADAIAQTLEIKLLDA